MKPCPPEFVIGHSVLRLADRHSTLTIQDEEGFVYPNLRKAYTGWDAQLRQDVDRQLMDVRTRIDRAFSGQANETKARELDAQFADRSTVPPRDLQAMAQDIRTGIQRADNDDLLHFLGWHNASLGPTNAFLATRFHEFMPSFITDIETMAEEDQLPPESLGALQFGLEAIQHVSILDTFGASQLGALGIFQGHNASIGIAEPVALYAQQSLYDVGFHEALHAAESIIGLGMDEGTTTPTSGTHLWLREAFIEHTVQSAALEVEWDDPSLSSDECARYSAERNLMGLISQAGQQKIPMRSFADAFFCAQRRTLPQQLEGNFKGVELRGQANIVAAISVEYNQAPTRDDQLDVIASWHQRLSR